MSDEAAETQALMLEIDRRQRELDLLMDRRAEPAAVRFWRRPRSRFRAASLLLLLAVCGQVKIVELTRSWRRLEEPSALREQVVQAAVVPWRRLTGIGAGATLCDVWVSALGMAQVQCGAEVADRDFGIVGADGAFLGLSDSTEVEPLERRAVTTDEHGRLVIRALEEAPDLFAGEQWERAPLPPDQTANRAAIDATFGARRSELSRCAGEAGGSVELMLHIDRDGKVLSVHVEQSSLQRPDAGPCLTSAIMGWRFHRLTGATPVATLHRLQF